MSTEERATPQSEAKGGTWGEISVPERVAMLRRRVQLLEAAVVRLERASIGGMIRAAFRAMRAWR